ncbi:hypothetical protein B0H16DRAFT_1715626 [Mycena metata]|uniref:Uncharacterized protein n=1 Tax=Mycena metata TaxID=1033252 RepID=A0AAD7JT56_9AGAR|nr:hypothetical protein B0H16DRAFT_1715626 [Mycena metata]
MTVLHITKAAKSSPGCTGSSGRLVHPSDLISCSLAILDRFTLIPSPHSVFLSDVTTSKLRTVQLNPNLHLPFGRHAKIQGSGSRSALSTGNETLEHLSAKNHLALILRCINNPLRRAHPPAIALLEHIGPIVSRQIFDSV